MNDKWVPRAVLALTLALLARHAAALEEHQVWIGSLPAHRALCLSGSGRGAEALAKVPTIFVERLAHVASIGSMYFTSVVPDQAADSVGWRLCAPVAEDVPTPDGFEQVDVPSQPAIFGLCTSAESAAACSESTLERVRQLVDPEHQGAVEALRPRGIRVAAVSLPLDAAAMSALAQEMVDPGNMVLVQAGQPDAALVAPLQDDSLRRRAAAIAPASAPLTPNLTPRNTSFVAATVTADLAAVLTPLFP